MRKAFIQTSFAAMGESNGGNEMNYKELQEMESRRRTERAVVVMIGRNAECTEYQKKATEAKDDD